ncbi:MAG: dihydroorotate dehydrogenase electron transfer subunit [Thermodesulfobacteriota bacterium]
MSIQTQGIVLKNKRIQSLYFLLEIECPPIATLIKPGQFVMLKVCDSQTPLLRRPFSLFRKDLKQTHGKENRGWFSILYKVVGRGTQKMTELEEGESIDLIGPLGNGFSASPPFSSNKAILIGGGVGIVPLLPLAEAIQGERSLFVLIGGNTDTDILCLNEFKKLKANVFVATEDGSLGRKGTVIDLLQSKREELWKEGPCPIYSSGPVAMLKALAKALGSKKSLCEASLEARMACGFGACWGCVIKTRDPKIPYQRVCKEGPVFNLGEIIWED